MTENEQFQENIGLVKRLTAQWSGLTVKLRCELEDVESIAREAVLWAIRNHDPARGALSTAAFMRMRTLAWRETRFAENYKRSVSRERCGLQNDDGESIASLLAVTSSGLGESEAREAIRVLLEKLDERTRAIILGRFFDCKSLEKIGAELCLSSERIRQIEADALKKMGRWLRQPKCKRLRLACDNCGKKFYRRAALDAHRRRKMGCRLCFCSEACMAEKRGEWTEDELRILYANARRSRKDVARKLGKSVAAINSEISRRGVTKAQTGRWWWSEQEIDTVIEMRKTMRPREIGKIIGRTGKCVSEMLRRLGRNIPNRRMTAEQRESAARMIGEGRSNQDIALAVGASIPTIYQMRRRMATVSAQ